MRARDALVVAAIALCPAAAAASSAAEADVPIDRHVILSLYGDAKLQFAAYVHAQASWTTRDIAGADTSSTGSYDEFSFYMKASASETLFAMAKMDVEDEDDLVEQLYVQWDRVGGSPLSVSFGEKQVRFGQWAALCYNSGLAYGWPMVAKDPRSAGSANLQFPGWMTDVLQFETKLRLHATTNLYFSSMLNPRAAYGTTIDGRARDPGLFASYSAQLETNPVEGLSAKLSVVNFHDEEPFLGNPLPAPAEDATAWSAGVTWHRKPWRFFAEYVGARDWDNVAGYDLRVVEAGVWLEFDGGLGVGVMFDDAVAQGQGAGGADAKITSWMAGIGYTLEKQVKAYLEYVHQEEASARDVSRSVQAGVHWWF